MILYTVKFFMLAMSLCLWSAGAQAQLLRVTLLGTGGPPPDPHRSGPAVLVEAGMEKLLFDAGRGVVEKLQAQGTGIQDISKVFLTHLHSDHLVGLPDLWLTGFIWQREGPLKLFGPKGTAAHAEALMKAYEFDVQHRIAHQNLSAESAKILASDVPAGEVYSQGKLHVRAFVVDHGPLKPAYGYRIDYGPRSVVISGDTRYSPAVVAAAKNADLLIHEVAAAPAAVIAANPRLQKVMDYHASPEDAARVFKEAKPHMAVFTHVLLFAGVTEDQLMKRVRDAGYDGPLAVGQDLMSFDVGEQVVPRK